MWSFVIAMLKNEYRRGENIKLSKTFKIGCGSDGQPEAGEEFRQVIRKEVVFFIAVKI